MAPRPLRNTCSRSVLGTWTLRLLAIATLTALPLGCKPKPPPPPPAPVEAPPEVKAPPKCETMQEKCAAASDTRAKIASTDLVFTPAAGWIYAQFSGATIAQASDTGPAFAIMGYVADFKDTKKDSAARDAALNELAKQLGLAPIKTKVLWKSPTAANVGDLKLGVWQFDKAGTRGTKKGPIFIVAGAMADGKGVVGLGFVPDDDSSGADGAIQKSIESIGKAK